MRDFEIGDLVEVDFDRTYIFHGRGWGRAIVMEMSDLTVRVQFLNPPDDIRDYCARSLASQSGLWSEAKGTLRFAENPTDEEIAMQTAFLLTGELPSV